MMSARLVNGAVRFGNVKTALPVWCRFKATVASPAVDDVDVKPFSAIPGPKPFPIIGHFLEAIKNVNRMNEVIKERHEKYGPIYKEKLGSFEFVFLTDVEAVEQLLRQDGKYPARRQIDLWVKYREDNDINKGLFLSDGEDWHVLRRVVDKHMMKIKTVESYTGEFNNVIDDFLTRLSDVRSPDQEITDLSNELFNWSLESVASVVYEKRLGLLCDERNEEVQQYIQSVHDVFETSTKLFALPPNVVPYLMPLTYKKHNDAWATLLRIGFKMTDERIKEIKEQIGKGEHVGFITHFLKDETMTIKDVYANTNELIGAAVDTTSNTAMLALYEISRNPDVQNAILNEINRVVPPNEQPQPEHIRQMSYIKAVVKETLRMYPIASAVIRQIQQDAVFLGYEVPKGGSVVKSHRSTSLHYEDPDTFRPERWLRETGAPRPHPFAWLPFGFGPRMCVGRRVAEQELHLLISQLIRKFRLEPVTMEPIKMHTQLLLYPKHPPRIRAHNRK